MTMQPSEALLFLAMLGLAADLFVASTWSEQWFRFGPIILRKVVQASSVATGMSTLERVNQRTGWPKLEFRRYSNRTVVFREALIRSPFTVPYLPLMRGEVVVDNETSTAYVQGRLNPFFMTTTLCLLGALGMAPGDGTNLIGFVPLLILNLWLQWARFRQVAKAITLAGDAQTAN